MEKYKQQESYKTQPQDKYEYLYEMPHHPPEAPCCICFMLTRGPGWSWRMECTVIKNRCCGPETAAAAGILVQLTRNVVININI